MKENRFYMRDAPRDMARTDFTLLGFPDSAAVGKFASEPSRSKGYRRPSRWVRFVRFLRRVF